MQVVICSKCKTKGTKNKPLLVIGDYLDKVSFCCNAPVEVIEQEDKPKK